MKVWGWWYGGPSYASPIPPDTEEFDSLQDAKDALWRRSDFDPFYPAVEESSMWVFFYDPREVSDPYPDRVLTIGPRGGVRVERA